MLGQERQAFRSSASGVTATLETLLHRDTDFVETLRTVLTMEPHLTATGFNTWYGTLEGSQRQVGGIGSAVVSRVPAAALTAFEVRRDNDPAFQALLGKWLAPIRREPVADYCLLSAGGELIPINSLSAALVQQDWCLPSSEIGLIQAPLIQNETDSGGILALPIDTSYLHTLLLESAVYRRGAPVATVAERRAAQSAWLLSSFDIPAVIHTALNGNQRLTVQLYYRNPGSAAALIGADGPPVRPGDLTLVKSVSIHGSWTLKVQGQPVVAGISAGAQAALVLAGGVVVSLLIVLLLVVLTRSRERALGMVREKTGELRHQALHDALTGLPNRVLALDRAEQMLARARRAQLPMTALYVDVDGFKSLNDTFGHAAGDEILRTVARRLESVIRESDTAARLGGDEFVVLLDGLVNDAGAELVAERLLEVLREPCEVNGRQLTVSASIGLAHGLTGSAEQLLADADVALYVGKASGKNRYVVFESGMQEANHERLMLEMDLADALANDELFLLYQPTFDLASERPIGVEALLRWRHPERGVIGPDTFIPIAEDNGSIVPIGRWVLGTACAQAAEWRDQGYPIGMSVNVSGCQLDSDGLIDDVREALEASGLDPAKLTLEITETTLMRDVAAAGAHLAALKALGVRLAIDDFGSGYSSLPYLREFAVDALKIDRSFISSISGSNESAALIQTLVRLGKTLNLETLAEGIEDHAQLQALQRHHCDQGQGFLFARPLEVAELEQFLGARSGEPLAG